MYFRLKSLEELNDTSYRVQKQTATGLYIEYNSGYISDDWEQVPEDTMRDIAPEWFETSEKPSSTSEYEQYYNEVNASLMGGV